MARLLEPLTRPELDTLLDLTEQGYARAQARLATCPMDSAVVIASAEVAQDNLGLWQDALDESIWRLWHGETLCQ